jgi:hypothetical protein
MSLVTLKLVSPKSNMAWNFDVFLYTVHIYIYVTVLKSLRKVLYQRLLIIIFLLSVNEMV